MNIRKIAALIVGASLLAACGINLIPSKDDWYAMHVNVMQDYEWQAYKQLGPTARLEFQKIFWTVRSTYAKDEFDKRVEYCMKNYKREDSRQPFNVNRAHIYILNGPPAKVDYSTNGNWVRTKYQPTALGGSQSQSGINESVSAASVTVWIYPIGDRLVHYMFQFQTPNTWALWPSNQEEVRDREQLELGNKNGLYAVEDAAAYKRKLEALKSMKEAEKK